MNDNPYAPIEVTSKNASQLDESLMHIARRVFLDWEKLRVLYIIVLAIPTVIILSVAGALSLSIVATILFGAVTANVLYFAGPIVETYVRWLGYQQPWPRFFLFWGGTLLSLILAVVVLTTLLVG